uniref:probable G-protein coupled receptor 148 n=1 Tax=Pristiophorus japonicus TaxID=55135 RepID=UPI00398F24D8
MTFLGVNVSHFRVTLSAIVLSNAANSSENCSDSLKGIPYQHLNLLLISIALCLTGTLSANPLLLVLILLKTRFRQETRYLLLANIMVSDLIFLLFNSFIAISNAAQQCMPKLLCDAALIGLTIAYASSVITITIMAIDTYVAVSLPLRYMSLVPPSRTIKLIMVIWILASMYSFSLLTVILARQPALSRQQKLCIMLLTLDSAHFGYQLTLGVHIFLVGSTLACLSLVLSCYIMLYYKTRSSGIWNSVHSRARMTLLIHGIVLFLYFVPGLFIGITILFDGMHLINNSTRLWLNTINSHVFTMLPRLLCPFLYGLRYRELAGTVKSLFIVRRHRVHSINT